MRTLAVLFLIFNMVTAQARTCEAQLLPPDELEQAENAAIRSIEATLLTGDQAAAEVVQWVNGMWRRQNSGGPILVMEYSALLHVVRSDFLRDFENDEVKARLVPMLQKAWRDLTGKEPGELKDLIDRRLPYAVLRGASHEARAFHAAVFQSANVYGENKLALGRDYLPQLKDLVMAMGLTALAFNETGREMLGAAIMGLSIGVMAQHLVHRCICHPSGKIKEWFKRAGWLGKGFYQTAYLHGIHHYHTYQTSYVRQFDSPEQKAKVDAVVKEHGIGEALANGRKHGLLLDNSARLALIAGTAPFAFVASWLMDFNSLQTWIAAIGALAYIPHLELTHIAEHEPEAELSPIVKWFTKTRYFAYINRMHAVHHRLPSTNYDGIPGVDLLFGKLRKPTVEDILAMRAEAALIANAKTTD